MNKVYIKRSAFIGSPKEERTFVLLDGVGINPFIDASGEEVVVSDGLFVVSERDRSLAQRVAVRRGLLSRLKLAWLVVCDRSDYAKGEA